MGTDKKDEDVTFDELLESIDNKIINIVNAFTNWSRTGEPINGIFEQKGVFCLGLLGKSHPIFTKNETQLIKPHVITNSNGLPELCIYVGDDYPTRQPITIYTQRYNSLKNAFEYQRSK